MLLSTKKLTASQLVSLLQILGALVADYSSNPSKPMSKDLRVLVRSPLRWQELPGLKPAIQSALTGGDKVSTLYNLGVEINNAFQNFRKQREYTDPELGLLKAISSYLRTDSETALAYIRKNASIFSDADLAQAFTPDVPKADNTALRKTVKSLVGRDDVTLSFDEAQLLKETEPANYAKYNELRKAHNAQAKVVLMNFVRAQKKKLVPYQEVYGYMLSQGFTHSLIPGFTGLIDDQGKWYSKDGELLEGVPTLATYTHVTMNDGKIPDQNWAFKAFKLDGTFAYGYTAKFRREQSSSKYKKVRVLMEKIPGIRKKWLAKVKQFDVEDKNSVAAVILEILYSFAARQGSSQPGRGVSTLVAKQARLTTQGINLSYLGKDSIPTKHVLKMSDPIHKLLISALNTLLAEKSGNDYIFTYQVGNKLKRVTPDDVNKAFTVFGAPEELTVHKLRTCRGTTLFTQLAEQDASKRPPKDEKEALLRWKKMTEEVGKLLNHKRGVGGDNEKVTGATAALSYIDGDAQNDLWERWGFRLPKQLDKMLRAEE